MTLNLLETIQKIVRDELDRRRFAELAIVQETHPHSAEDDTDNYACTVVLRNSGLILKRVPLATDRIGHVAVPPVGALVLVHFLDGDLNGPVIGGSFYNDEDRPPPNGDDQAIWHLPLGASEEEAVHAELHSGETRKLQINLGKGISLALQDAEPGVVLNVGDGKAVFTIAADGGVTLESTGDLTIDANNIAVKGSEINMEASGNLNLKGATINLN